MSSVLNPKKLANLGGPRTWAAIYFAPAGLELSFGRNVGGQVNVTQQPSAPIAVAESTTDMKVVWENAATALRARVDPAQHHIATVVGCENVLCQTLRLPTTQPGELKQMLDLQIDNLTPLPLEEVVYGFQSQAVDDKSTRVLVTIARKDAVNERVAALEAAGLPAEIVAVDALMLFQGLVSRELLPRDEKLNTLIIINATATHLIVHTQGHPVAVRSIMISGTELLTEHGQSALGDELQRTLIGAEADYSLNGRGKLTFLTWADGQLDDVRRIADRCGEPSEILANGAVPSPVTNLCQLVASGAVGQLNLLPQEWREKRHAQQMRRNLIRVAIAVGAVYVLVVLGFVGLMAIQRAKLRKLNAEVSALQPKAVKAKKTREELLAMKKQLDTKYSALEVLREVSVALPDGVKLNSFQFKKDLTVTVRGQAQGNNQVIEFTGNLEKSPLFGNIKPGQIVTPPGGGLTRFDITCTLKSATDMSPTPHGHN